MDPIKSMFKSSPQVATAASTPAAPEPVRIASANDPDMRAARLRAMRTAFGQRRGRDETDMDRAPAYSRTQLG